MNRLKVTLTVEGDNDPVIILAKLVGGVLDAIHPDALTLVCLAAQLGGFAVDVVEA